MKHSEESKKKLSIMRIGDKNPFYGKRHSPETIDKLRERNRGRKGTYNIGSVKIKIPNDLQISYMAGMIDGDGSIGITRHKRWNSQDKFDEYAHITVYNTSVELMEWIVENYGGKYNEGGRGKIKARKTLYAWRIMAAKDVYLLAKHLSPFLVIKRNKADEIIKYLESKYGAKISIEGK